VVENKLKGGGKLFDIKVLRLLRGGEGRLKESGQFLPGNTRVRARENAKKGRRKTVRGRKKREVGLEGGKGKNHSRKEAVVLMSSGSGADRKVEGSATVTAR